MEWAFQDLGHSGKAKKNLTFELLKRFFFTVFTNLSLLNPFDNLERDGRATWKVRLVSYRRCSSFVFVFKVGELGKGLHHGITYHFLYHSFRWAKYGGMTSSVEKDDIHAHRIGIHHMENARFLHSEITRKKERKKTCFLCDKSLLKERESFISRYMWHEIDDERPKFVNIWLWNH